MTDPNTPSSTPPSYDPAASQPYNSAPPAAYNGQAQGPVPGRTLGIVALVVSIFFSLIGLIMGIVALVQSRKAGVKNGWAVAAIIVGSVLFVVGIIIGIFVVIALTAAAGFASEALAACEAIGFSGTVTVEGVTVDCATLDQR